MQELIVAAAIRVDLGDGRCREVYSLPRPARHCDVIWEVWEQRRERTWITPEMQGFVTHTGRFVGREEAARLAIAAGQIKECKFQTGYLFSEDLW